MHIVFLKRKRMPRIRYTNNRREHDGAGHHAPHINLTHVNGDIHVELKKTIQSDEERTLLLTPEQFFDMSHKSDDIRQAGHLMANYHGSSSEKQPTDTVGSFKFILRTDFQSEKHEHMYEWEMPNSRLRVSIRNRRSDGKRPIDTQFVVEIRVFTVNDRPTDEGIMMAWHNFHGTFVRYRKERRNRIQEMRANGSSPVLASSSTSNSAVIANPSVTTLSINPYLPSRIIDERYVNDETNACVICMDTYVKNELVHGLPQCSHFFHPKSIQAWLVGKKNCPVCRSQV